MMDNPKSGQKSQREQQPPSDEPMVMHQLEHRGVTCDVCDNKVCGFRYKCMVCPDFDLCRSCEIKGHHVGHVMMRIPFPEQAVDAIPRCHKNTSAPRSRCPFGRNGESSNGANTWTHLMKNIAEQYACGPNPLYNGTGNAEKDSAAAQQDWDAASLQVQEFLNAWGVPINVSDFNPHSKNKETGDPTKNGPSSNAQNCCDGQTGSLSFNDVMDHFASSSAVPPQQNSEATSGTPSAQPTTSTSNGSTNEPTAPLGTFLNSALQHPQVQQIIKGVTNAAENVTRNVPPTNSWIPNLFSSSANDELRAQEEKNKATLNQLLSMGFSNENGWLERLVAAKNGHLEAVLNYLFSTDLDY